MTKRTVALVGIGKIARDQHVPAISASPDWELAATVSRNGKVEGVAGYLSIEEMLEAHPEVDVISLCLPPVPRFQAAVTALRASRHVMLEKPPGATVAECHALHTLAQDAGVSIFATWHSREASQVANAKAWLAGRQIRSLQIIWKEDVRRWHPGQDWIWQAGGLGVFDPGINALSILTEILNVPVRISSAELYFPENCETPIAANLEFGGIVDADMNADFDFRQQGDQTWAIEIATDDGEMVLSEGGAKLSINGNEQTGNEDENTLTGEYPRLYARMHELVSNGGSDFDLAPMVLTADAFLLGRRVVVDPFHE